LHAPQNHVDVEVRHVELFFELCLVDVLLDGVYDFPDLILELLCFRHGGRRRCSNHSAVGTAAWFG
jgi:hypothetical protein